MWGYLFLVLPFISARLHIYAIRVSGSLYFPFGEIRLRCKVSLLFVGLDISVVIICGQLLSILWIREIVKRFKLFSPLNCRLRQTCLLVSQRSFSRCLFGAFNILFTRRKLRVCPQVGPELMVCEN